MPIKTCVVLTKAAAVLTTAALLALYTYTPFTDVYHVEEFPDPLADLWDEEGPAVPLDIRATDAQLRFGSRCACARRGHSPARRPRLDSSRVEYFGIFGRPVAR